MPSEFLTPFLELEEEFCKNFRGLEAGSQRDRRASGFQRRHSLCPVTLPNSKFNGGDGGPELGGLSGWGAGPQRLPRSSLSHIPFRVDRSVSMIEGVGAGEDGPFAGPPPGLSPPPPPLSPRPAPPSPHASTRYKTELCRTFEESGTCKYGAKCQFAHGGAELRGISRHPKYKTELCRTFHTIGFCPYGARCHFIHNADELAAAAAAAPPQRPRPRPPLLRHSLSFAGFSSSPAPSFRPLEDAPAPSLLFARASSVSPTPPSTGTPELLSPLLPEPGPLRHSLYPFSGVADLTGDDLALHFRASPDPGSLPLRLPRRPPASLNAPPGLQRCSSADSLSEEGYASSCSLSSSCSGAESPSFEGRRLPIFSRLSVTDE